MQFKKNKILSFIISLVFFTLFFTLQAQRAYALATVHHIYLCLRSGARISCSPFKLITGYKTHEIRTVEKNTLREMANHVGDIFAYPVNGLFKKGPRDCYDKYTYERSEEHTSELQSH